MTGLSTTSDAARRPFPAPPWAMLAGAAVLALYAAVLAPDIARPRMLGWDESEYASLGRGLLRGEGYRTYGEPEAMRLPVVPLLAAGTEAVAPGGGDRALRVMELVVMLAAIAAAGIGVARVTDPATGIATALMTGAIPMLRVLATQLLSEGPYLLLFVVAVWALHEGFGGHRRGFLVAAVAIGLAALTRYNAWLFGPIAVLMVLVRATVPGAGPALGRALRTRALLLAPLVTLAVMAPWLVREWLLFGSPLEGVRISFATVGHWHEFPFNWYLTRLPLEAGWPVLALAPLGVLVALRERDGAAMTALIAALVVIGAHSCWHHKEDRYVSAALPFLAALAAIGVVRVIAALARVSGAVRATGISAFAVAALAAALTLRGNAVAWLDFSPAGYPVFLRAMETVRRESRPGDTVLGASGPLIAWYADRPVRRFPDDRADLPEALDRVAWVVLVDYERMQPEWASGLTHGITADERARGDARVFASMRYRVELVRGALLRARVGDTPDTSAVR